MTISRMRAGLLVAVGLLVPTLTTARAWGSDHADTAENVNRSGADLNDLYIFPSPDNANNVVLVMDVWGLIPAGQTRSFDPRVLYQFKIDTTGDAVEDLVIQAKFEGTGPSQRVRIAGPIRPARRGTQSVLMSSPSVLGRVNVPFFPTPGVRVFAGLREDPFFIDLEQFYAIFPDRMTPLTTRQVDLPDPNTPKQPGWRNPGRDFFNNLNTLAIVVELPRARLGGGVIRVWMTTSVLTGGNNYRQQARQARPLTSEVLGTVTNRDHEKKNKQNPTEDPISSPRGGTLEREVEEFLVFPAERSEAIRLVIRSVLIPDVMIADLSQAGPAAYLGVETKGATGGLFGGRKLVDDVLDISAMVVFGTTISELGLAPADGKQKPSFTSDNVGPQSNITGALPFPFLPNPALVP